MIYTYIILIDFSNNFFFKCSNMRIANNFLFKQTNILVQNKRKYFQHELTINIYFFK